MTSVKVAIQMDEPEVLDKESDSTVALIEEALKRKYRVHIYTVDDLSLRDNLPIAICREVKSVDIKKKDYDVVMGMYHDQVLAPFKALYKFQAINITLGLSFLRISPDHGVAKDLIKKNKANPDSLISAINFFKAK